MTSTIRQIRLPLAEPRARAAARLWAAAAVVLALMPLGMAIAHRSSPTFLVLATVLAFAAEGVDGRLGAFVHRARAAFSTVLGRTTIAFLVYAFVSIGWSAYPAVSLRAFGELVLCTGSAFGLALLLPGRPPRWVHWILVGSLIGACLVIIFELRTGLVLRRAAGVEAGGYIFNRPVLTVLVCLVPLLAFLTKQGGWRVALAAGLALLVLVTERTSESGAAGLGILAGVVAWASAILAPSSARLAAAAGVVFAFGMAPFLGSVGNQLIPPELHRGLSGSHSRERIDIWISFGDAIRKQPLLGGGFGVSSRIADTAVAADFTPERRAALNMGHAHNAPMQIWAELGLVGVLLSAAVLVLILRSLAFLPPQVFAPALGLFAGAFAVSLVGHGAWQGWWAAALGAAIVWFRILTPTHEASSRRTPVPTSS
ncbi:MAG TPA: O-antigen ligase family protein [Microvirga sp.]|nr:O-antigen ligase family protein [Microvirga sp.]